MAKLLRKRFPFLPPDGTVDHLVVGAGVVGLAVAERLLKAFPDRTTFVVERHGQVGQETSSRNSEVIHSGIYYPPDSLKTRLCIRGRDLLYDRCHAHGIGYKNTGKLVLATSQDQLGYLRGLYDKAQRLKDAGVGEVPLDWLAGDDVRALEPDVGERVVGALRSPKTGIVSSHELMEHLEKEIIDSETGELVCGTRVVRIDRAEPSGGGKRGDGSEDGWIVQTLTDDGTGSEGVRTAVLAKSVINASGLNAHHILNQILPESQRLQLHFAKGSYFSYRGPGVESVKHLLYPCPEENVSLSGLGTHLTLDLDGEVRFGPDVEWLSPSVDEEGEDVPDFWESRLAVTDERMELAIEEVKKFLPAVKADGFSPDYSGIRPKLSRKGETAVDFSITHPQPGFISLQGIESPGLTSSLAIGELVEGMVRREVWGLGRGRGRNVSEAGKLDAWA
ncbi:NAD(P)/FAD-dependent oxidoreductase [Rhodotorula paludigena]|uniref:NAD(P)/FAD-dependent oxidoreductase n=1 Tax=Rhodotorula paludigena TaxID=86838 RepID=UPI00316E2C55